MNMTQKMIIVLTVITMFSGGILSTWDGVTGPAIEAYKLQELKKAIAEVLPAYDHYEEITADGRTLYVGMREESEQPVGVAFEAVGSGFQGKISIMVGMRPDFETITGIKILEQIETPGLGTKIVVDPSNKENPTWFPDQFDSLTVQPQIEMVKNVKPTRENEIQAITGATISSKAIVDILNQNIGQVRNLYPSSASPQTTMRIN